ncbi:plasmid mobilization protein [Dyadobacter psychrophilus]|uniref:Uncharacterized protein n=1 Tax=Dyadobacter psychrophilus TaxID=651661 RepID=A0A1T5HGS3_9BACT|nr:hypothetical protein [Dyadobacter psychrophilus]SKC19731.1 hypothetical protein SAMN05660293_05535 [Dyadobacter psychrophilus]
MSSNPKRAGRKPSNDNDRKSVNIRVRLSKRELSMIKSLHDRNDLKNISIMVREILLKERIHVEIVNTDVADLLRRLEELQGQMRKILKTKTSNFEEFKPVAEQIMTILKDTYSKIDNIALSLPDLREYEEWDSHTKEWYARYIDHYKQFSED